MKPTKVKIMAWRKDFPVRSVIWRRIGMRAIRGLFCLWAGLVFLAATANNAAGLEFILQDGSVVHGTLDSFVDGIYTISSPTLGTLRIEAAKIKTLRSEEPSAGGPGSLQALQGKIVGDPEVMDLVKSLQNDPDIQAILTDKEIMHAITTGDLENLKNNPKMQKVINNPTMKEIERRLGSGRTDAVK